MTNEFNPDWDTQAVLTEEIQRMAKRIEELEAKGEPFGYFRYDLRLDAWVQSRDSNQGVAFYTTPPPVAEPHKRKPLTDEEIYTEARNHEKFAKDGREWFDKGSFARAIEAAHGIKEKA